MKDFVESYVEDGNYVVPGTRTVVAKEMKAVVGNFVDDGSFDVDCIVEKYFEMLVNVVAVVDYENDVVFDDAVEQVVEFVTVEYVVGWRWNSSKL